MMPAMKSPSRRVVVRLHRGTYEPHQTWLNSTSSSTVTDLVPRPKPPDSPTRPPYDRPYAGAPLWRTQPTILLTSARAMILGRSFIGVHLRGALDAVLSARSSRARTVLATPFNWMDDYTPRSRQSSSDTATPAAHCRQTVQPLRPICADVQMRMRPHAHSAAQDPCRARRVGRGACRCSQAVALLEVRLATMQRHGAARDETRWLSFDAREANLRLRNLVKQELGIKGFLHPRDFSSPRNLCPWKNTLALRGLRCAGNMNAPRHRSNFHE
jgi:hypothetical protein